MFKTPPKKMKLQDKESLYSNLTNTEKSVAYLNSRLQVKPPKIAIDLKRCRKTINCFLNKTKTLQTFANQNSKKGRWPRGSVNLNQRQKKLLRIWLESGSMNSARQCFQRLN